MMSRVRTTLLMSLIALFVSSAAMRSPESKAAEGKKEAPDVKEMSLRIRSIESYVVAKLKSDEAIWVSPNRSKEAIELLNLVSVLRSPKTVKPLLFYIHYHGGRGGGFAQLLQTEATFPVVGCLVEIGTPAVEPLIELIKSSPKIREDEDRRAADGSMHMPRNRKQAVFLAVHALSKIYDHPAGRGKDICQFVLQAELKATTVESEREGLRAALKLFQKQE